MKLTSFRIAYHTKKDKSIQWFDVDVSVSKVDGLFTFPQEQVPKFLREAAPHLKEYEGQVRIGGVREVYKFERLTDIEPALQRAVGLFEESQRQEASTKWIAYKFRMNGNLTPDLGITEKGSIDYSDFALTDFRRAMGLAFEWHVVDRSKYAGIYHFYYENGASFDEAGFNLIEHSEDRAVWFESMEKSMTSLMLRVHGFMQIKPEELKNAIDLKQIGSLLPALAHTVKQTKPKGKKK